MTDEFFAAIVERIRKVAATLPKPIDNETFLVSVYTQGGLDAVKSLPKFQAHMANVRGRN